MKKLHYTKKFLLIVNLIFVVSYLKIHPAVYLNTSKALKVLQSKRKVYSRFTSIRYSDVLTRVKKDKMVAERLDVQIEQTRIIITLVTIMIMLSLYRGILRTLAQSELFIQVFSGIFRYIQHYSVVFRHTEAYAGIIEAY